jgi:hypothetical protein
VILGTSSVIFGVEQATGTVLNVCDRPSLINEGSAQASQAMLAA